MIVLPWVENAKLFLGQSVKDRDYAQAMRDQRWLTKRINPWIDSTMVRGNPEAIALCEILLGLMICWCDWSELTSGPDDLIKTTIRLKHILKAARV